VGARVGRQGTVPGAPGVALGAPGSPGVDRGGHGTVPGAPGVAPDGLVCPGVAREEPGWGRPGMLGRWDKAGAGCPYTGDITPGWGRGVGPVGAKAGRHGTAPGAPGVALGWPGSPGVDRGGQGTAPGAPGVALDGPGNPGVVREEPGWARPGVLERWDKVGAGCPYAGGTGPVGVVEPGSPWVLGEAVGTPGPPAGTPARGACTCWAMLPDTAPKANPSRNIPITPRHIRTQRECDTASPSHLRGYTCTIASSRPRRGCTDWVTLRGVNL